MKKELEYIKKEYAKNGYFYYNDFTQNKSAHHLLEKLNKSQDFEQPDFYFYENNTNVCYLFEHFEFDASLNTSKGSLYRKKSTENEIEITNEANKFIKENKEGFIPIIKHIETAATKSQWEENFFNVFDSHYKKINKYKEKLKNTLNKQELQFVTTFVIEDKTEFGAYGLHNGKGHYFHLHDFDIPLHKLLDAKEIDYFIFLDFDTHTINIFNKPYIIEHENDFIPFNEVQLAFIDSIMEYSAVLKTKKE